MPDGLGPTETLTTFERYDKGGGDADDANDNADADDDDADADGVNYKGGDDDLCNWFQIISKLERAEEGSRSCNAPGNHFLPITNKNIFVFSAVRDQVSNINHQWYS